MYKKPQFIFFIGNGEIQFNLHHYHNALITIQYFSWKEGLNGSYTKKRGNSINWKNTTIGPELLRKHQFSWHEDIHEWNLIYGATHAMNKNKKHKKIKQKTNKIRLYGVTKQQQVTFDGARPWCSLLYMTINNQKKVSGRIIATVCISISKNPISNMTSRLKTVTKHAPWFHATETLSCVFSTRTNTQFPQLHYEGHVLHGRGRGGKKTQQN